MSVLIIIPEFRDLCVNTMDSLWKNPLGPLGRAWNDRPRTCRQDLESVSNDDGNGNENVTRKYIFISFVLLLDYFNSLNFYRNDELSRNQIGRSGVHVKKENEKFTVVRSSSPQNLNVVISRCCFAEDGKEMYQNVKRMCIAIVFAQ